MFDFIKNISPTEIIILVVLLIVLFGRKVIVGLGKTSGETVKEIKRFKKEFTRAVEDHDSNPNKN